MMINIQDLIHVIRHATPTDLQRLREAIESKEGFAVENNWTEFTPEDRAERLKELEDYRAHGD